MCPWVPMAMMAASAVVSIAGQQQQAKAQREMAAYNAKISQQNAIRAEENVRKAQIAGAREEYQQNLKTSQMLGEQKVAFAASGINVGFGTADYVSEGTKLLGYNDIVTIRENTKAKEQAFRQQGADFTNQATLSIASGRNAQVAANYQGIGTFLDAGSSMYSSGKTAGYWGAK